MIPLVVLVVGVAVALAVRVVVTIIRNNQPAKVSDGWRDEHARGRRDV